jgi:predicted lipoprotein with Yx(FWY)xxD motif
MNISQKRTFALALLVAGSVMLAACGSNSTTNSSSGGGAAAPTLRAETVGNLGMVLVDSNGMTLYFLKGETASNIQCTGTCATQWPPLTVASGVQPTVGDGVTGQVGTVQRSDGTLQVTYDGKPLYTFVGDSGSGQASGQGVSNFFAATPSAGSSGSGSQSGSSGYYP